MLRWIHFSFIKRKTLMAAGTPERIYQFASWLVHPLRRFIPSQLSTDEKQKRIPVVVGALLGIPTLLFFTVQDIRSSETIGFFFDGGLALMFIVLLWMLIRVDNGIWIYRVMLLGLSAVAFYNIVVGPSGQSSVFWMFIFPLAIFYVLGVSEGLFWFFGVTAASAVVVFFPDLLGSYDYPVELRIRFFSAYMVVSFLSVTFEMARWFFYSRLEIQRSELKTALDNIRTLSGLLPICSICKKIRDDRGYWNQLEMYLSTHTDVKLSHGVCEECLEKHYPVVHARRCACEASEGRTEVRQTSIPVV